MEGDENYTMQNFDPTFLPDEDVYKPKKKEGKKSKRFRKIYGDRWVKLAIITDTHFGQEMII